MWPIHCRSHLKKRLRDYSNRISSPLGVNKTSELCKVFYWCLNLKERLCLDPARLNQALIQPVYRGPIVKNIFPKLTNAKYMTIIDMSSGYYNTKLYKWSLYLTTFSCQFGRYRYKQLLFEKDPAGDMFQRKADKIFRELPNTTGIADDILFIGYDSDGADHDRILHKH